MAWEEAYLPLYSFCMNSKIAAIQIISNYTTSQWILIIPIRRIGIGTILSRTILTAMVISFTLKLPIKMLIGSGHQQNCVDI